MNDPPGLDRYDRTRSYAWNYEHVPDPVETPAQKVPGNWRFCDRPVPSPLGISAGPLLNGKWCLYYASLGFDVLTYKTVRSGKHECHPLPNLQPVANEQLTGSESEVQASDRMLGSWAVSFGMPSQDPQVWRRDVEQTRARLPAEKLLSVSVVGTIQEGWSIAELAEDYARCARWAVESGADAVETNLSCPNVTTCDGQLYRSPDDSKLVAERVREAIGSVPYIMKIGYFPSAESAGALLDAVGHVVDALALTNSIATMVRNQQQQFMYGRQKRGICGAAIRDTSIAQIRMMRELITERNLPLHLIGVGGISSVEHLRAYLAAGAQMCHLATAPMVNPVVGLDIRNDCRGGLR
jgi:dihydroorotate dehydrogenase